MSDAANKPVDEVARLRALRELNILDTGPDATLDRITKLAAQICDAPIAMVSLTDESRQWFKSVLGSDTREMPRQVAFCAQTILSDDVFVLRDTAEDPRFSNSPLVVGPPYIRSYAGAPLIDANGFRLGSLCVAHTTPTHLSDQQLQQLADLAAIAMDTMTARLDRQSLTLRQKLLESIAAVQHDFIFCDTDSGETFDHLLEAALTFTDSEYCVIDEVTNGLGAARHIKRQAGTPHDEVGVDLDDLLPLLDRTIAARDIVVTHETPDLHADAPPLTAFLGVPLVSGDELVGVLGLANRPGGYDPQLVKLGRPLFSSIANIVLATRAKQARRVAQEEMQQAKEAAIEANATKSVFLANTSHEIRTPLNGVLGMASALEATELNDKQRRMVNVITESGAALSQILNDILDLSKIEAGKLELDCTSFRVDELAQSVSALYELKAEEKSLGFSVEIDADASGAFLGDPMRIRQILGNLINNAFKFTREGRIDVHISRNDDRDDGFTALHFAVTDTGVGMSPDMLARVFDAFSQADASVSRTHGGTGLGLTIARELCEKMGGAIGVDSRPNGGTVFNFHVLVEDADNVSQTSDVEPDETAPESGSVLRILVAEDHPTNRLVIQTLLEPLGADVTIVENGREAVEAWAAGQFDVVLMDIQMPVMDGVDATIEIRRRELETGRAQTPIIAVTANALSHQVAQYANVGMDACVTKPIAPKKLYDAVFTQAARGAALKRSA